MFFFKCYGYHRDLHVLTHSFPTRRSSDLRSTQAFMLLSRSASSKRLTGGSLLSSRVSAGASFAPSAASAVAALSVLSPVHADSASATASERSRACGFLTVTWVSGPVRALDGKKHAGPPGGFGHRNTIPPRPAGRGCR